MIQLIIFYIAIIAVRVEPNRRYPRFGSVRGSADIHKEPQIIKCHSKLFVFQIFQFNFKIILSNLSFILNFRIFFHFE